jgi:hypothetical protein
MDLDRKSSTKVKLEIDDDEVIPVGDLYVAEEASVAAEASGNEEEFPLGNSKKPGTKKPVVNGNGYSGAPVAWMAPNIKLDQFAVAHIAAVSYGFEANGDPKPGFHNFVLKQMVSGEDIPFYTTKNIGADSLVERGNREGDVISFPTVGSTGRLVDKRLTAVWMVTRFSQTGTKLDALYKGFVNSMNTAKWNGSTLNQKVTALTPEHFLLPQNGIGPYVGQITNYQAIRP